MSSIAYVNTFAHAVTYVTDKMLASIKLIVVQSGLDPAKLTGEHHWKTLERGIRTWIDSKHLEMLTLEIFKPGSKSLVNRWDIPIVYSSESDADRRPPVPWTQPTSASERPVPEGAEVHRQIAR